jgi:hypothetical protein
MGSGGYLVFAVANNLHISYDLQQPGKNYDAVISKIKSLGQWARIHKSVWYVKSNFTALEAADALWRVMDASDTVYVVDATRNRASWHNLSPEVSNHIRGKWSP